MGLKLDIYNWGLTSCAVAHGCPQHDREESRCCGVGEDIVWYQTDLWHIGCHFSDLAVQHSFQCVAVSGRWIIVDCR